MNLNESGCDCVKWIMFNDCVPTRDTKNTHCIFVGYCPVEGETCGRDGLREKQVLYELD
jgi:hypothetical protein